MQRHGRRPSAAVVRVENCWEMVRIMVQRSSRFTCSQFDELRGVHGARNSTRWCSVTWEVGGADHVLAPFYRSGWSADRADAVPLQRHRSDPASTIRSRCRGSATLAATMTWMLWNCGAAAAVGWRCGCARRPRRCAAACMKLGDGEVSHARRLDHGRVSDQGWGVELSAAPTSQPSHHHVEHAADARWRSSRRRWRHGTHSIWRKTIMAAKGAGGMVRLGARNGRGVRRRPRLPRCRCSQSFGW